MICWFASGAALFVFIGGAAYGLRLRMFPHPYYDYFICHAKGTSAGQARLISNNLAAAGKSCFIDSDDLQDLTTLFETVRSRVGTLCVLLSSQTLSRPWCCGEVVTAFQKVVPKYVIREASFRELGDKDLEHLDSILDLESSVLTSYHITPEMIRDAYQHLMTLPYKSFPAVPSVQNYVNLADGILKDVYDYNDVVQEGKDSAFNTVLILSDVLDAE